MIDYVFSASILVQFALLFYSLGFLARDELLLRCLILVGTCFYLLYYYFINDRPLWDAIFTSSVLGIINLSMIFVLICERTTFAMSDETARAYQSFTTLTPGQFRKVMKRSSSFVAESDTILTTTGEVSDQLFLIVDGRASMDKNGKVLDVIAPMFIGEIGFLTKNGASATVRLRSGAQYLSWQSSDLRKMMRRSKPLNNAMIALFSSDLAHKVRRSLPIEFGQ